MTPFRPMRRIRQQLSQEQCDQILARCTSGVLALMGDGGYPYAVPMSYVYVDGKIYFHSAKQGHKVDAIGRDSHCSFCVIAQDDVKPDEFTTYFRSVIAFGRIHIVDDDTERLLALRHLGRRYSPGDEAGLQSEIDKSAAHVLLLCLDIEHMTGKEAIELVQAKGNLLN
ncbi:MAG: pyridoxamine 5'-phosphate oxidase family protein [Muribaculaceae bacterium]|nr:pyridoxamine 5'-phosphate oxidase family protein [Muribaculaceae bacterium]